MLEKKYLPLQNGSDVRGVALEGIEGEHVNLTEEIAYYIVSGFVHFVSEKTGKQIRDLKILANNYECYRYGKELIQSGNLNKDECEMIDAFLRIVERKFREEKQYQNKKEMFNHMKYVLVEEQKRLDEIKKQEEKKQRKEARKEKFKSFFRK